MVIMLRSYLQLKHRDDHAHFRNFVFLVNNFVMCDWLQNNLAQMISATVSNVSGVSAVSYWQISGFYLSKLNVSKGCPCFFCWWNHGWTGAMLNVCCNLLPAGVGEGIKIPDFIKITNGFTKTTQSNVRSQYYTSNCMCMVITLLCYVLWYK